MPFWSRISAFYLDFRFFWLNQSNGRKVETYQRLSMPEIVLINYYYLSTKRGSTVFLKQALLSIKAHIL